MTDQIKIVYLDFEKMETMCHPLAVAVFDKGTDPIPSFSFHTKGLLESAINSPRHTFDNKELYPTIHDKAAILYFSLIKNHPFPNGNKRIATASLLTFLYINNHWLEVGTKELAEWTIRIAKYSTQESIDYNSILDELKMWLLRHVKPLKVLD